MAPDDTSGARPPQVVLRIKLRYDDVEAMIQRFAPNVGKTGLFLPTKSIQPIGAEIKFELRLSTDQPVLVGLGRVKAAREPDPENPKATFGMAVELMRVTRESRDLILKMLERRKKLGLPDTGLPMPADIDAARRADFVESGVRDYASGAVPQLVSVTDSAPASTSFTAPRRQTGPIAIAKIATLVDPLAPEPPRKRRVPVAELIASASGPIVASFTTEMLDEDVDVAAVLARARALTSASANDLDGELQALLDSAAAPVEINIEAASAELARQLGGAAVRRDRSARWAPPPPTSEPQAPEPVAPPEPAATTIEPEISAPEPAATHVDDDRRDIDAPEVREPELPAPPEIVAPEPAATHVDEHDRDRLVVGSEVDADEPDVPTQDDDDAPLFDRRSFAPVPSEPRGGLIHDDANVAEFEAQDDGAHEVEPDQIHDEIHRLEESDFEEVENTQIGAEPVADPEDFAPQHAFAPMPADHAQHVAAIAAQLDAQLDEAEREDLGFSEPVDAGSVASAGFSLPSAVDYALPPGIGDEEEIEEIDDFEILAEADADDADLLASAAEQEVSGERRQVYSHQQYQQPQEFEPEPDGQYGQYAKYDEPPPQQQPYPYQREPQHLHSQPRSHQHPRDPSQAGGVPPADDHGFELPPARPSFLSRLELDDDSGYHAPAASSHFDELSHEPGELDPRILSAGHALRGFEEHDEQSDFSVPAPSDPFAPPIGEQSYTFAGDIPDDEFDAPHGNYAAPAQSFVAPDAFDQSDVISIAPVSAQQQAQAEEDFPDLESALEALDVDLDDLGAGPGRRRRAAKPRTANKTDDVPTSRRTDANIGTSPTVDARATRHTGGGRVVTPAPAPKPARTEPRAKTEDGIEIDFDDDE